MPVTKLPQEDTTALQSLLDLGTSEEEEADEQEWQEQFAATPADKISKLVARVEAEIREGKTRPMDFSGK